MNTTELQGAIERMVMDGEWLSLKELEALSDKLKQYNELLAALERIHSAASATLCNINWVADYSARIIAECQQ